MLSALYIVLWILAGLLGVLLILVVVPVHVRCRGSVRGLDADGVAEVRWGWGFFKVVASPGVIAEAHLVGLRVWRYRPKSPEEQERERKAEEKARGKARRKDDKTKKKKKAKEQEKEKEKEKKSKAKGAGKVGRSFDALSKWRHRKALLELIRRMLGTLRLSLEVEGRLGLGDPADTAITVTIIRQLDIRMSHVRLLIQPDYEQDVLDLDGGFSGRLWLIHIAFVFVAALFDRDIRRAMATLL
jgi:hypothetical protein